MEIILRYPSLLKTDLELISTIICYKFGFVSGYHGLENSTFNQFTYMDVRLGFIPKIVTSAEVNIL